METTAKKPLPLPPALLLVRAPSRTTRVADLSDAAAAAWPDTPPRRSPVAVPFLWEDAPGKPKAPPHRDGAPPATAGAVPPDAGATAAAATTTTLATDAGDHDSSNGGCEKEARPVPLKLPPRLQHVASARQRDGSLSPKSVLHGPYYYGCASKRPPPRRTASGFAAFRRKTPGAGVGLFSRSKAAAAAAWTSKNKGGGHHSAAAAADAPWSSPAASSASSSSSSSSSSSLSTGSWYRRAADAREDGSSEEDECAGGSVRITRFRRNRSFPSMTTSHLWASIRKSVKQITPWS